LTDDGIRASQTLLSLTVGGLEQFNDPLANSRSCVFDPQSDILKSALRGNHRIASRDEPTFSKKSAVKNLLLKVAKQGNIVPIQSLNFFSGQVCTSDSNIAKSAMPPRQVVSSNDALSLGRGHHEHKTSSVLSDFERQIEQADRKRGLNRPT